MRKAWIALSCAILMTVAMPSKGASLLVNGSKLIFTGDATVSATFLNWLCDRPGDSVCTAPPANTGDFAVTSSTSTFSPYNGTFGLIKDLSEGAQPIGATTLLTNFITFELNNNITLDLTEIPTGTDTPSATCAGINHCTPTNGVYFNASTNPGSESAFDLDYDSNSNTTTASFSFFGIVHDNTTGTTANFVGSFSEPLTGVTPQDVVNELSTPPGTITQGYGENGTLTITTVPEPVSLSLMGAGLLIIGLATRRQKSNR